MRRAMLAMTCCPITCWSTAIGCRVSTVLGKALTARAIIGGDATEPAISAASILAKTARDGYMDQMHTVYPAI